MSVELQVYACATTSLLPPWLISRRRALLVCCEHAVAVCFIALRYYSWGAMTLLPLFAFVFTCAAWNIYLCNVNVMNGMCQRECQFFVQYSDVGGLEIATGGFFFIRSSALTDHIRMVEARSAGRRIKVGMPW